MTPERRATRRYRMSKPSPSWPPNHRDSDEFHAAQLQQLQSKILDLELSLLTANEHGDLLQDHLYRMSNTLSAEVRERQAAELKLKRILEAVAQEKADLEIMLQILIEQGDLSAAEGEQARIDGLTRIANRRRLDEHLLQEWERHRSGQYPISFLLCDVDHFKLYNDRYGHQAGDNCLKTVGELISGIVRAEDLVARYGGEEFAVVLPRTTRESAILIAERTRAAVVNAALAHAGSPVNSCVTISIGVGCLIPAPEETAGPSSLICEADRNLYRAKSGGRNCVNAGIE